MNGDLIQPSDFEQQEWFIHQQQIPPVQHALAWQLDAALDLNQLERGLVALVAANPCFSLRYRFDDRSGLIKTTDAAALPPVSRHPASSVQQALDAVTLQQASAFDLHHTSPVRFMLFSLASGEAILAVIAHQILAEQLSWDALSAALSAAYQQQPAQLNGPAAAGCDLATSGQHVALTLAGVISQPLALAAVASPAEAPPVAADNAAIVTAILTEFRDALAMPQMRAEDDFFDQGGHSLIATRVIGRLLSLHQIEVSINDLFSYPTAQALAAQAKQHQPAAAAAATAVTSFNEKSAPLSLAQQSLWKIYAAMGYGDIFNLPFVLRFVDEVDEELLHQAMHDVLVRHAGLRTLFMTTGEGVRQRIVPAAELGNYRWFWPSAAEQKPAATLLKQEAAHLFDLAHELPLRLRFTRDAASGEQLLSLLFHHMVLDEWSLNLMMDDLQQAYQARAADRLPQWQEAAIPFHEFAIGQYQSGLGQQHLNYWLDTLRGVPLGKPIFSGQAADSQIIDTTTDLSGSNLEFTLPSEVTAGLYALSKRHSASLFNVVYAGIASTLHFLGGPADMVIGTSASGRNDARYFDTVGYFTTVVAHRLRFDRAPTLAALVAQVKSTINDSMPHTDVPIDMVEEALLGEGAREDAHMFEAFIQIHSRIKLNGAFTLPDGRQIAWRQVDGEKSESILGLQFEIMEEWEAGEKSLRLMMTYRSDHYTAAQAEKITATTQALLGLFSRPSASDPLLASLRAELAL